MGLLGRLFRQPKSEATTPEQIGKALFYFVGRTITGISEDLQKGRLEILGSVQPAIYLRELVIMNLFSVDFAVFRVHGHGPVKNAVLDSFWLEHEALQVTEPEYAALTKGCKERLLQYSSAVQQGGDLLLRVGRVFASACGCPGEHLLAMQAGDHFGSFAAAVKDILSKLAGTGK